MLNIPADRHKMSIFSYCLIILLTTIIKMIIAVFMKINLGFVNMLRSGGIS